jgi:hypothetical protein
MTTSANRDADALDDVADDYDRTRASAVSVDFLKSSLAKGSILDSKEQLKAALLRYHHSIHRSYLVCKSEATQFAVSCPCNRKSKKNQVAEDNGLCPFSVRASKKRTEKEGESSKWKITKSALDHTCNNQGDRVRNYRSADLENAFKVLSQLKATTAAATTSQTRGQGIAAASKLSNLALQTTGRPIKLAQARKMVAKLRPETSLEMQLGQFHLVQSYFSIMRNQDPMGSFLLEEETCQWNPDLMQFRRYYVCLSAMKHAWITGSMRVMVPNGAFQVNGILQNTLLLGIAHDGDGQPIICAFAIVNAATSSNWTWFLQHMMMDFPYMTAIFDEKFDKTYDFQRLCKRHGVYFRRSIKSLVEECRRELGGTFKNDLERDIVNLSKSPNELIFQNRLQQLRVRSEEVASWFEARTHQFVLYVLLDANRWPLQEEFSDVNARLEEIITPELRAEPVLNLTCKLITWTFVNSLKHREKAEKWIESGIQLTDYATRKQEQELLQVGELSVSVTGRLGSDWSAQVTDVHAGHWLHVQVNCETFTRTCPCHQAKECGRPCLHILALLVHERLNFQDPRWYDEIFHLATTVDMYNTQPPDMSTYGVLSVKELVPCEFEAAATPELKTKRRKYTYVAKTVHVCSGCGKGGHHFPQCTSQCMQYLYERNRDDSLKHASIAAEMKDGS